jgi:ketosteroid isomerase-like protein
VRSLLLAFSFALSAVAAGPAFAQSPAPAPAAVQLSPAANDAVQLVDAFVAALAAGQLDAARQFMAPNAVVVANGQVLGTRDAYIDGPARGDAAALRTVERDVLRRDVNAGPDFGYVVTEKRMRVPGDAKGPSEVVIETMLIAKTAAGWKITHIHWSGRHAR